MMAKGPSEKTLLSQPPAVSSFPSSPFSQEEAKHSASPWAVPGGQDLLVLQLLHAGGGSHGHGDDDVVYVKGALAPPPPRLLQHKSQVRKGCGVWHVGKSLQKSLMERGRSGLVRPTDTNLYRTRVPLSPLPNPKCTAPAARSPKWPGEDGPCGEQRQTRSCRGRLNTGAPALSPERGAQGLQSSCWGRETSSSCISERACGSTAGKAT